MEKDGLLGNMIYRKYGSTGIDVSAMGFGGMRFDDQNDVDACAELVMEAYRAGVNVFDTAPGYGRSEELFGAAFRRMSRTRGERPFYVSTKTGAGDEAGIRRDLERSLERMGLDYIDFYHVWCVVEPKVYSERAKPALKVFEKLKDEGLIRHICISSHMSGTETAEMLKDYPFAGVLLGYSAMNFPYREAALDAARELGIGVAVMNPLGGGLVPGHPERFEFVKSREDESVVEGALRFLLNDSRITLALVGLGNRQQLSEAVRAVDGFRSISQEKVAAMRENVTECFDKLCTSCCYCDKCPQGIPVPKIMQSYNCFMLSGKAWDMVDYFNSHWCLPREAYKLDKCTDCGLCEEACTQRLPVRERLKEARCELERPVTKAKEEG